ncbi:MAG: hypothetical protein EU550_00275 [Promethearchaeota archaeon]|nr:MAG: hypothetical protein EU550_00275 [Candidatus Lokiarchaeota archaeon]
MKNNYSEKLELFQKSIGYRFKDPQLLKQALTTPRYGNENGLPNYQILETIGDSVLKLIFSIKKYKEGVKDPGKLTKIKQQIENDKTFKKIALKYFDLVEYIFKSEDQQIYRTKILADILEAICGAIYLDSNHNLETVENVIVDKFYLDWNNIIKDSEIFNKNILLEFLQEILKFTPKIEAKYEKQGVDNNLRWIAKNPVILDNAGGNLRSFSKLIRNIKSKKAQSKKEAEQDLYKKIFNKLSKKLNR